MSLPEAVELFKTLQLHHDFNGSSGNLQDSFVPMISKLIQDAIQNRFFSPTTEINQFALEIHRFDVNIFRQVFYCVFSNMDIIRYFDAICDSLENFPVIKCRVKSYIPLHYLWAKLIRSSIKANEFNPTTEAFTLAVNLHNYNPQLFKNVFTCVFEAIDVDKYFKEIIEALNKLLNHEFKETFKNLWFEKFIWLSAKIIRISIESNKFNQTTEAYTLAVNLYIYYPLLFEYVVGRAFEEIDADKYFKAIIETLNMILNNDYKEIFKNNRHTKIFPFIFLSAKIIKISIETNKFYPTTEAFTLAVNLHNYNPELSEHVWEWAFKEIDADKYFKAIIETLNKILNNDYKEIFKNIRLDNFIPFINLSAKIIRILIENNEFNPTTEAYTLAVNLHNYNPKLFEDVLERAFEEIDADKYFKAIIETLNKILNNDYKEISKNNMSDNFFPFINLLAKIIRILIENNEFNPTTEAYTLAVNLHNYNPELFEYVWEWAFKEIDADKYFKAIIETLNKILNNDYKEILKNNRLDNFFPFINLSAEIIRISIENNEFYPTAVAFTLAVNIHNYNSELFENVLGRAFKEIDADKYFKAIIETLNKILIHYFKEIFKNIRLENFFPFIKLSAKIIRISIETNKFYPTTEAFTLAVNLYSYDSDVFEKVFEYVLNMMDVDENLKEPNMLTYIKYTGFNPFVELLAKIIRISIETNKFYLTTEGQKLADKIHNFDLHIFYDVFGCVFEVLDVGYYFKQTMASLKTFQNLDCVVDTYVVLYETVCKHEEHLFSFECAVGDIFDEPNTSQKNREKSRKLLEKIDILSRKDYVDAFY